ncbi:MAG: carbohydrate ABC transporter permease [Chloroflexi bacterium]|nr:carbohydrate ABC transporter permease [Chloroflexota bacterium]
MTTTEIKNALPRPGHSTLEQAARWMRVRAVSGRIILFGILILGGIWALVPIYWTLSTSFKTRADILKLKVNLVPQPFTLGNYDFVITERALIPLRNSIIVAIGTVVLGLVVATLAGYAAARFNFPGKRLLLGILLLTIMLPGIVILIPLYIQMVRIGLLDTYEVLILLTMAWVIPFTVWLMKGFFEAIPPELDAAAMVDGYSRLGALLRVVLPLSRQGLAAGALYIFIAAWNSFLYPLIFTNRADMRTLPLFLYSFLGYYDIDWGRLAAGGIFAAAPVVLLFILLQRSFIEGLIKGSLKG